MLKQFVHELYQIWITERPGLQAAALAFFSMFSFAPVIFIAFSMVGIFADEIQIGNQFYQRLQSILGEEVALLIQDSITALSNSSSGASILISIISFLALLFTASGVFFQLQYALNTIWRVPPPEKGQTLSYIRQRLFSFVIVIGVGLLGIMAVLTNLVLAWFGSVLERLLSINPNLSLAAGASALLLLTISFALFYKFLPETKVYFPQGIFILLLGKQQSRFKKPALTFVEVFFSRYLRHFFSQFKVLSLQAYLKKRGNRLRIAWCDFKCLSVFHDGFFRTIYVPVERPHFQLTAQRVLYIREDFFNYCIGAIDRNIIYIRLIELFPIDNHTDVVRRTCQVSVSQAFGTINTTLFYIVVTDGNNYRHICIVWLNR